MKHSLAITLFLVILFLATQFVGLKVVDNYIDREQTSQTGVVSYKSLPYDIERPDIKPDASVWLIVVAMGMGTLVLLVLMKFRKIKLWKLWFFLSVVLTLSISLSSFIPSAAAFVISLVFAAWKVLKPNVIVHNLTEVFIYGGLAAIFVPILNVPAVFVLLIIISAYDMFAVWQSRHMVKMAQFQTDSKLFSGLYIPHSDSGMKAILGSSIASSDAKKHNTGSKSGNVSSAVLGGGDMGFPLIFAAVVMKQSGFLNALIIPVVAAIALFGLMVFAKKGRFYPAMPFLTAACFVGYGLVVYVLPLLLS